MSKICQKITKSLPVTFAWLTLLTCTGLVYGFVWVHWQSWLDFWSIRFIAFVLIDAQPSTQRRGQVLNQAMWLVLLNFIWINLLFQNALYNSNIWILDSDMWGGCVHICGLQFHAVHLHGSRSIPKRYCWKLLIFFWQMVFEMCPFLGIIKERVLLIFKLISPLLFDSKRTKRRTAMPRCTRTSRSTTWPCLWSGVGPARCIVRPGAPTATSAILASR